MPLKKPRKPVKRVKVVDTDAARDLEVTIENDGRLYESQFRPIVANLMKKRRSGVYRHDGAVKLFGYLVEAGAKKYAAEFGDRDTPWHVLFSVPTRRAVAESLARSFETEADLGNYDHLAPPPSARSGTRTKTPAELRSDIARATGVRVR